MRKLTTGFLVKTTGLTVKTTGLAGVWKNVDEGPGAGVPCSWDVLTGGCVAERVRKGLDVVLEVVLEVVMGLTVLAAVVVFLTGDTARVGKGFVVALSVVLLGVVLLGVVLAVVVVRVVLVGSGGLVL